MSWNFDWITPQRILFGAGRFAEIGALAAGFGSKACLITGARSLAASGRLERSEKLLAEAGVHRLHLTIDQEPTVEAIDEMAGAAAEFHPHLVVAVGGGSVLDAGKAVAALLANGGQTLDYLEGVGRGRTLDIPSLPVIAAPTTAGTGREATKNAVIGDRARTFKRSMRADGMMPAVALVDPELTYDCPPAVTAACGMDALTQLLESYTSRKRHPMSEALGGQGLYQMQALARLPEAEDPKPLREHLSLGALLGGICLANVGLGAVHGLVAPLGGLHPVPHGAGCAALLPPVVRANARRLWEQGGKALITLQEYGVAHSFLDDVDDPVTGDPLADALRLADTLADLNRKLGLPGLGHYGLTAADFPAIVAGARGNSMKSNPVDLTDEDLIAILEESL